MSTGLFRIELGKLRVRLVFLPAILFAGAAGWLLVDTSGWAESDPAPPATATTTQAAATPTQPSAAPANAAEQAAPPVVNGLKISSQSWRRGGLGSNALFTFTLRNTNDYAVKDVEIHCAFTRKDGSHLTDRTRVIPDTIDMKSRKTFTRMHVGFVNVNASKAVCSLVTAGRL